MPHRQPQPAPPAGDHDASFASVCIGIVGHRPNRPLGADLHQVLEETFARIGTLAPSESRFVLVSGLAEGADQIAAQARPETWKLHGLLPFTRLEYETDFTVSADGSGRDVRCDYRSVLDNCDRVTEIASSRDDPQAYLRSGLMMLGMLNVLVAVWDGEGAAGAGGTADIVRAAADAGITVLWVNSNDTRQIRLIARMPVGAQFSTVDTDSEIDAILAQRLSVLAKIVPTAGEPDITGHGEISEIQKLSIFSAEAIPSGPGLLIYNAMKMLLSGRSKAGAKPENKDNWESLLADAPAAPAMREELAQEVWPLYRRADTLAIYYANTYRSAYVLTYASSFVAVLLALAGLIIPHHYPTATQVDIKALLVAAELLIVGVIVATVIVGTRNRWHQKWMDYRAMAEALRHLRFLAFMGAHRRFGVRKQTLSPARESWTTHLVAFAAGRVGLPDAVINPDYLAKLGQAIRDHEVEQQLRYHTGNARSMRGIHHALHRMGDWCFYLTAALLAAFLLLYGAGQAMPLFATSGYAAPYSGFITDFLYACKVTVGVLAAALPALGAALSGIRFTGEFETFAGRSQAMAMALFDLRKDYAALARAPDFDHATGVVLETAAILSSDIEDWKTLYTHKRLSLPA